MLYEETEVKSEICNSHQWELFWENLRQTNTKDFRTENSFPVYCFLFQVFPLKWKLPLNFVKLSLSVLYQELFRKKNNKNW